LSSTWRTTPRCPASTWALLVELCLMAASVMASSLGFLCHVPPGPPRQAACAQAMENQRCVREFLLVFGIPDTAAVKWRSA
jgi:hypothetical protein